MIHIKSLLIILLATSTLVHAKVSVFACEPEWAALTRELGGTDVNIYTATNNRQDPHHIQARPSLIAKARRADLLVCTGAELEAGWLPLLLRKSGNSKIQRGKIGHFMATDHVRLLGKPKHLDRRYGDIHAAGNPHIQLDPRRMLQVATQLSQTFINIDPGNRARYQNNLRVFNSSWQKKMRYWKKIAKPLHGKSVVVHHDSWLYLQQWLGMTQRGTLEPIPGIPPTSAHLSTLLNKVKKQRIHKIIYASSQSSKAAQWLSSKTGTPTVRIDISPGKNERLSLWFERVIRQLLR
jgi:zinc/manganese transport system substrate-binding protein